jgi:hypothetical protein
MIAPRMVVSRGLPSCVWAGCLLVLALPLGSGSADNEPPPGFVALFNGRDLSGWRLPHQDGGHWKVVNGVIDYDAESEAPEREKSLWSQREFRDFILLVDWRLKEAPFVNPEVRYILPDGTHARDIHGQELHLSLPDADSGILLRGSARNQVNIWCWPIGSGEMYSIRTGQGTTPDLRAAVTPRMQADKPVGQWNRFEITVRGHEVKVVLNGKTVLPGAKIPNMPELGRIGLQHHGHKRDGKWDSPPALIQFKNIFIKELN